MKNPVGALYWNIMIISLGIAIIPIMFFLVHRFSIGIHTKFFDYGFLISDFVACIGFIGVGVFPDDQGRIHVVFGTCAFFGLLFALNFLYSLIFWERKHRKQWKFSLLLVIFLVFALNLTFLLALFLPFIATSINSTPPISPLLQFPLWEWLLLIVIFISLLLLVLYAPYNPDKT